MGEQPTVLAIALDANSMPYGFLKIETLAEIRRLASKHGLRLWLPEPVLWEWQQHSVQEYIEARADLRRKRSALAAAGVVLPDLPSPDDVGRQVREAVTALGAPLEILKLSGEAATQALRDQILVREPGERVLVRSGESESATTKDGAPQKSNRRKDRYLKTGASDSATLRLILDAVQNETERVVLLGGDKDIARALVAWDLPPMKTVTSVAELTSLLSDLVPLAPGEPAPSIGFATAAEQIALVARLHRPLSCTTINPVLTVGFEDLFDEELLNSDFTEEEVDRIVGVRHFDEVGEGEASAEIVALVSGGFSAVQTSIDGSDLVTVDMALRNVPMFMPALLRTEDSQLVIVPDGRPRVVAPQTRYSDAEDAFEGVSATIRTCPGLSEFELPEAYDGPASRTLVVTPGTIVEVGISGLCYDEWELSVEIRDSEGKILGQRQLQCSYDDTAWVGGREGFNAYPPWTLSPGPGDPAWDLAAWITTTLVSAEAGADS
ncbi:hypothetical protein [Micromonospora chalcea]|uniref:hypothetical protein n=1 Tax=Micromonospora chalcea TaxID=1874 RepID=UPI003F4A69B7